MNKDHLPHLNWLANEVIAPILGDEFHVFTPDVDEAGNIMHHVIRSADRSTLVVADMTQNNPNVLYEIAVLDAMGRACVPVKLVDSEDVNSDAVSFDRAAYRCFRLLKGDAEGAQQKLKPVIETTLNDHYLGKFPDNPLTDFFGFPLSTLSSAHGLARGYFNNFIVPVLKSSLMGRLPKKYRKGDRPALEVIIPPRIDFATREMIEELSVRKKILKVETQAPGRKITGYVWNIKKSGEPALVDIPTAFGQLRDNVLSRLGRNANPDPNSEDFREIEADEIAQFTRFLRRFRDTAANVEGEEARARLRILRLDECRDTNLYDGIIGT